MTLMVGNTYTIVLDGFTATQGYNQLESFINFPNTIFQLLSVSTTFTADTTTFFSSPLDKLYLDACQWENDPNSLNYLSCVGGDGKAGGTVGITYTVEIIGGGGTSQTLNSLFYDFSGSSFHYNSDFSTGKVIANIVDPTNVSISKSFSPNPTNVNGVSTLTITLTNPNSGAISGLNLVDIFPTTPGSMTVASPLTRSNTCGGTLQDSGGGTLTAGAVGIKLIDGVVAANSSCIINVNVTTSATGTYTNTTNNLFVGTVDTGETATADLTVNNSPAPPACTPGLELARWTMETSQGTTAPPTYSFISSRVSSATASYTGTGTSAIDTATGNPVNSWSGTGWAPNNIGPPAFPSETTAPYFEFVLNTSNFTNVAISSNYYIGGGDWAAPTNNYLYNYSSANGGAFSTIYNAQLPKGSWQTVAATASTTGSSTTAFRINAVGAKDTTRAMFIDNIIFTGCGVPQPPSLTKAFSPNPIAVNAASTLTFTLTNENNVALTGAAFTDALPSGLQVANPTGASNTCGATFAPAVGATTLTVTGGTIPARVGTTNGSCTVTVSIKATTAGPHNNVTGYISSIETGTNTGSTGSASATLTAVLPPVIAKQFNPASIPASGTSTLTFYITNPNQNDALSGVAFTDVFPVSPGAMTVASPLTTTNTCGGALQDSGGGALGAGDVGIRLTGGTIAGGGSCTVSVNVTAATVSVSTYNNISGSVSHIINAATDNGNTASASLTVTVAHPSIAILKQISSTGLSGPWSTFLSVSVGANVWYKFTIENTGDVALNPVSVTDPTLAGTGVDPATCSWTNPLPAASPTQDPIQTCVTGPVAAASGTHPNIATAHGTYSSTVYNSTPSTATYSTTGLTLVKGVTESSFGKAGDLLHYTYLVTNSGAAVLAGPVAVTDDKVSVTCPNVNTVGDFDSNLDPGESITCTATYTVTSGDATAGFVTNTASATVAGVQSNTSTKTVTLIPTLVTLSEFSAYNDNGRFVVQWTTSSETDTAGFYLFRHDEKTGRYRQINSSLLPALFTSPQGGTYSLIDNGASITNSNTYVLVEIEGRGRRNAYGPFSVSAGADNAVENQYSSGPRPAEALFGIADRSAGPEARRITRYVDKDGTIVISNKSSRSSRSSETSVADEVSDYQRTAKAITAEKRASLEARAEAKATASLLKKQKTGNMVKISVSKDGLYYMNSAEISSLLGMADTKVKQLIKSGNLALSNQGNNIAYIPAYDMAGLFFYAQGIDSMYTKENIYWLYNGKGLQMGSLEGAGPAPAGYSTFTETVHAEEDKVVAPALAKDPGSDYWFWDYVIGGDPSLGTKLFDLQAFGVANTSSDASLTIRLHGLTATGAAKDHHVIISLNGTEITTEIKRVEWKGAEEHVVSLNFSQGLLYSGTNSIEIKGLLDFLGAPYSIFFVDSFDLTYRRLLEAHEDSLIFSAEGALPLTVYGFTKPDLFVFDITDPDKPIFNMATTIDGSGGNYSISFIPSPGSRYLATASDAAAAVLNAWADSPSTLLSKKNWADYIIITTKELVAAARELAHYREGQGLKTMVVDLEDIMDEFNYGISSPEAIHDFLSYAYANWKKAPKYVVIAGDGTYDYKDNMGIGDNLVPTLMAETPQIISPSDNLFADMDGDHVPDIAIGRLPVLTAEELRGVINKIIAYESTAGNRVVMLADNQDEGGNFPSDSDDVAALVPAGYSVAKIYYLSGYTLAQARQLLFDEIQNGAIVLNYMGHAGYNILAVEGLLQMSDVASLQNSGKPFVLAAMTCTVGNFALPGYDSLSEALVTKDRGGAVAVWAPTGLSLNFLSKVLDEHLFRGAFGNRGVALGDVILRAFKNYHATGGPAYIMDIYNLQGDPALRMW